MDMKASKPRPPPVAPKPKRDKPQSNTPSVVAMATESDNYGPEMLPERNDPTMVESCTKTDGGMDPLKVEIQDTDITVVYQRESIEPQHDAPKRSPPPVSPKPVLYRLQGSKQPTSPVIPADEISNETKQPLIPHTFFPKEKAPVKLQQTMVDNENTVLSAFHTETTISHYDTPKPCPSSISPKPMSVKKNETHSVGNTFVFGDCDKNDTRKRGTSEKKKDPKDRTYEDMAAFRKELGLPPLPPRPTKEELSEESTKSQSTKVDNDDTDILPVDCDINDTHKRGTSEKKKDPKDRTYEDMAAFLEAYPELKGLPDDFSEQPPPLPPRPTNEELSEESTHRQSLKVNYDDTDTKTPFNVKEPEAVDSDKCKRADLGPPELPLQRPPPLPPRPTSEVPSHNDIWRNKLNALKGVSIRERVNQTGIPAPSRHTKDTFDSIYLDMDVLKDPGTRDDILNQDNTTEDLTGDAQEMDITSKGKHCHTVDIGTLPDTNTDEDEMLPPPSACKRISDDFIDTDIATTQQMPQTMEAEKRSQNSTDKRVDELVNDRGGSGGSGYFSSEDNVTKRNLPETPTIDHDWKTLSTEMSEDMICLIIKGILQNNTKEEVEKLLVQAGVRLEDVKSIHVDHFETIIKFHDADDAVKWSDLNLSDEEYPLQVSQHYLDIDPYKAFITGFSTSTTEESLKDYLQEASIQITDIQMGRIPDTAMVTFQSPKIDMQRIKTKCQTQPMNKKLLKVYPVKMPNTIKIFTDKDRQVTFTDVREYRNKFFNDTRNQDEIVWDDKMKCYIVKLKGFEEVKDMCNNGSMTASPGYCLGFDPTTLIMPEPVELQGDSKHFAVFANNSTEFKGEFSKLLKKKNGFLWRDENDRCLILCTVDLMEPLAKQKIENWAGECSKAVEGFIKAFTLTAVHVEEQFWKETVALFADPAFHIGSHVTVNDLNQEDFSFVLVGESTYISKILDIISDWEKQLPQVKKKKKMKPYHYELLMAVVEKKLWKKSIIPKASDQSYMVYFEGTYKETTQGMDHLYHILNKLEVGTEKGYDHLAKDLLETEQISSYIKTKMTKENLIATYNVTDSDVCVYVYPTSKNSLKRASDILISSINMKHQRLQVNNVLGSDEWTKKLLDLRNKHTDWFRVELTTNEMKLVCADLHFDEVYSEVLEVLDSFTTINSFFEIDIGKWRFIEASQKDDIVAIKTKCSEVNVILIESDNPQRRGFTLRGKKGDCKNVIPLLQNLVDQVYHHSFELSSPSFSEIVQREDCMQELLMTEFRSKCGLHIGNVSKEEPCQPVERARTQFCRRDIVITEGDITNMIVDGVVNPVDCCLQNMTSAGAAIVDSEGYNFQLKCDQFIRTKGEMAPGSIFFSESTTELRKGIISVALPFWASDMKDENQLLELAVQNSLQKAVEENYTAVVIPSLESSFNYPLEDSSDVMVKAVTDFFCSKLQPGSSLLTVYLCGSTVQLCNAFENALKSMSARNFRSSTIVRHIEVDLIEGELANIEADAIVVTTTHDLNLRVGRLSRSLLMVAGEELQEECSKAYPQGINLGQVGVTSGANMQCKYVLYGRLEKWDDGKGCAEKVMGVFVEKCLSEASRLGLVSIAFPALGTGNLGFEPRYVADLILDCVYTFKLKNKPTSLKNVYLVVYPSDEDTIKAFKDTLAIAQQAEGIPGGRYRSYSPAFFEKRMRFLKSFGDISVEVVSGDITKEKTHAIVNSINSLQLDSGIVSKAIFNAAGPTIQMECRGKENRAAMSKNGFVETGSGNLDFCKKIIHLAAKDTKSEWKAAIRSCLEAANSRGYNSLSFPAIGTGGRGCTPEMIASAMFSAISKFSESCKGQQPLRRIRIVIYKQEMIGSFVKEARRDGSIRISIFPKPKKEIKKQSVTFHLYGKTPSQIYNAETLLHDLFHSETIKIAYNSIVQQNVERIAQKHNVLVDFGRNVIHVHGLKRPFIAARNEIQRYLLVFG